MKRETWIVAGAGLLVLAALYLLRRRAQAQQRSPQALAAQSVSGHVGHYFPAPGPAGAVLQGESTPPPTPNPQPLSQGYNPTYTWSPLAGPGLQGY